ncbi:MAG: YkgJ family cysteine cluster protein [Planctomycetota bacterium]|mgnify:CR=1 FL=1
MGTILCEHCTAACCRYLSLPLDTPRNARDYDDVRWYLMHEGVMVYVEEGRWYIQLQARCRNLGADNRCMVYETRPTICREYEPGDCDYSGGDYGYQHLFTRPEQVEELYRRRTGKSLPTVARRSTRRKVPLTELTVSR